VPNLVLVRRLNFGKVVFIISSFSDLGLVKCKYSFFLLHI
jgi:hypothetical protein